MVVTASDAAAALPDLTQAVRKYAIEQKRAPKSFGEALAAGFWLIVNAIVVFNGGNSQAVKFLL